VFAVDTGDVGGVECVVEADPQGHRPERCRWCDWRISPGLPARERYFYAGSGPLNGLERPSRRPAGGPSLTEDEIVGVDAEEGAVVAGGKLGDIPGESEEEDAREQGT